jgi:starch synthase
LLAKARLDDGIVFGNVGRMARQKGLGLLDEALDALVAEGMRLVLVGNGELDGLVDDWVERQPKAVAHLPYDEPLSRLVSAGADAYLMPSQFEPCGLGQMYSMRYGAPPVVRLTGGLADTVLDIDEYPETGTGFGFRTYEPMSLVKTIRRAMRYRAGFPKLWQKIQHNGMTADFSWSARAKDYEAVYLETVR